MMEYDILITNGCILPLDSEGAPFYPAGYVTIRNGVIVGLGSMAELAPQPSALKTIDAAGRLVMPGLINTHTHAAMTLLRGFADDLPLMTWLTEHIFPVEAKMVDYAWVYWGSKLAAAEMIGAGITTAADSYFYEGAAALAFQEAGLRAVAAQGVVDFSAPGVRDPADNVAQAAAFIEQWQSRSGLVAPAVFCHSPYTCSAATLKAAKALAREKQVPFFIHCAETREERERSLAEHGQSPLRYLHELELLDSETVCVHCVWVDEADLEIMAAAGVKVAHCPRSNMKLASGIAPIAEMVERRIPVGLGTDGCASNNVLDLFAEMDGAAKLQKVRRLDPTALSAQTALAMATTMGAGVLGLAGRVGSLRPGMRADIIIVDLQRPHLRPLHHAQSQLVYAARGSDVQTVIIDGRPIMEDRLFLTLDVPEIQIRAREIAQRLEASAPSRRCR